MTTVPNRTFTTDLELKKLKPEDKHYWMKDMTSPGLFLEVSPKGTKTWQYRYSVNGKQERVKLGQYPAVSLNQARIERAIYEENYVSKGISKAEVKKQKERQDETNITFRDFALKFAERYITGKIKNHKAMIAYLNNDIFPFIGDYCLNEVKATHVDQIITRKLNLGFPAAAHQIRQLLRRIFEIAVDWEYIERSPVKKTILAQTLLGKPKQRALTTDEISAFYSQLFQQNIARATKLGLLLSLLVLVRKTELTTAKWEHINFETGIWHIPTPKGSDQVKNASEPFDIYMSSQVKSILNELKKLAGNSPYILPGRTPDKPISRTVFNTALSTVLKKMEGFGHFTVHDLRRTAASRLNDLGYESDIIEKCLNHKMMGIRGIYNKAIYEEQRRNMMQEWSSFVFSLVPILNHVIELNDQKININ